jgi:hypothetical protein
MRRVATVVAVFVLLVACAGVATYRVGGPEARQTGMELYAHRWLIERVVNARSPAPPRVVWLGDSTLQEVPAIPSYASIVERDVLAPAHLRGLVLAAPGMDFYSYWSLAGRVAALRPKAVFLVANLRTFDPAGGIRGLSDVLGEVDLADVPATLALPYYVRGMTAPRVLLARVLRTELGEDLFLTFEGVRRQSQDAAAWNVLGPAARPPLPGENFQRLVTVGDGLLAAFDRPLGPGNPMLRFIRATVARLASAGAEVRVIVTPVPRERGTEARHYDRARFEARIGVLAAAVEAGGGRLVDLHRALTRGQFRDVDCHFNALGAAEMAKLLEPELRAILSGSGDR